MAVLKHFSIKNSPLALLKYITGETKAHKAEIVTGINCSVEPKSAYMEMELCYENYAGEKFHRTAKPVGKEHIKMHHYVISFKGKEVTPQEAHSIAEEWAKKVFGDDRQILIATHTDTDNIHVHIAVNAFSMNGKRWLDNKSTMNFCREEINKICEMKHLDVIKNPKKNGNKSYAEWLASQNGKSWKEKLCDDIDRIVLLENVKSISDLTDELSKCGYTVNLHKYLSVKPAYLEKCRAVRTLRLGDGYGLEELQYRIENKDKEMPIDKVLSYSGIQRDYALCLRNLQIMFYRKENIFRKITYSELRRNADLLCYISKHKIHSKSDFEKHVNAVAEKSDNVINRYKELRAKVAEYEEFVEYGKNNLEYLTYKNYFDAPLELRNKVTKHCRESSYRIFSKDELDKTAAKLSEYEKELADMQDEYEKAVSEKKAAGANYRTFLRQLENDYSYILKSAKKEIEEYEKSHTKQEPPKNNFSETAESMRIQEKKAIAKAVEEERLRAKKQAEQERRNRDRYSR